MPTSLKIGISIKEFMNLTEEEFEMHVTAYNNRVDELAWLNGMYNYNALNTVLGNMFSSKDSTSLRYPSEPYGTTQSENKNTQEVTKEDITNKALYECY